MRTWLIAARILIAAVGGLLVGGSVVAAFQIPLQQPRQEQGQPKRSEAPHDSQSVPNKQAVAHLGIEIECDPNCAAKESQEHRNENWAARLLRKSAEDPLALFTGILALATMFLALYTATVANATKAAAEHIPRVERAYMFAGPANNRTKFDSPPGTVKVIITVSNRGKTPGVLIESFGQFLPAWPKVPPSQYDFSSGGTKWSEDLVFGANTIEEMPNREFVGVKYRKIFFIGYIKYRTVIDDLVHTSYWCVSPRRVSNVMEEWGIVEQATGWNSFD